MDWWLATEIAILLLGIAQGILAMFGRRCSWHVYIAMLLLICAVSVRNALWGDLINNSVYIAFCVFGMKSWGAGRRISSGDARSCAVSFLVCALLVAGMYLSLTHVHELMVFLKRDTVPFLDSLTTATSFVAMWHMMRKRTECWIWWGVNDLLYVAQFIVLSGCHAPLVWLNLMWFAMAVASYLKWRNYEEKEDILRGEVPA